MAILDSTTGVPGAHETYAAALVELDQAAQLQRDLVRLAAFPIPVPAFGALIGPAVIRTHWMAARDAHGAANDHPRFLTTEECEADLSRRLRYLAPSEEMVPAEATARDMLLHLCGTCGGCVFARVR